MNIKLYKYRKVVDDRIDFYQINEMNTNEEATKLLSIIKNNYGEMDNVRCIKMSEEGKVLLDEHYSSMEEFLNANKNLLALTLISFSCKDNYITFSLRVPERELIVSDYRHTYGDKKANEEKFTYFMDEDENIIRYNEKTGLYYQLDKTTNTWYSDPDTVRRMIDPQYSFTEIEYNGEENKGLTL